ncbi:glycosyltransferase family 2 protein [Luteimonas sp. MC1572]|uniref:glycosyltransferase family 2 protein n=1 Tax=Luteimonas sp. MC1572 TaxID=2799325 RepID=UPI0018F07CDC|nr:glycosyltransferase family 2 protein [Luteimonas sp. MC1572]MBJ6981694.1 glycosyltransferase family 2 protein [Luteimonas sp. MC1572]QQO02985.1 glycosyltransferase family 2 protein [Luteimonas sp. MC1572]
MTSLASWRSRDHALPRAGDVASIGLLVTTYNWKDALALVLESVMRQTRLPDEVIVADDGSGRDTADLIAGIARGFPVPLRHAWQEDRGFRAARSRNQAIAACRADYLLLVDGDMVLDRRFVADHARAARPGTFVQGSRVLTGPRFRDCMLARRAGPPNALSPDVTRRRNAIHARLLSDVYRALNPRSTPHAIKTCNQGWRRDDLLRLNGFDERMEGWGREDVELAWRAFHAGIACRQLRYAGLAYHLHHTERHQDGDSANDVYLAETRAQRLTRCARGLDAHLAQFAARPLHDLRYATAVEAAHSPAVTAA